MKPGSLQFSFAACLWLLASTPVLAQTPAQPEPATASTPAEPGTQAKSRAVAPFGWLRTPTAAQVGREYPRRAMEQNVQGHATVRCKVTETGKLADCEVISETPEGYGFGKATIKLATYFVMPTKNPDGKPTAGAFVNIGIPFRLQ